METQSKKKLESESENEDDDEDDYEVDYDYHCVEAENSLMTPMYKIFILFKKNG